MVRNVFGNNPELQWYTQGGNEDASTDLLNTYYTSKLFGGGKLVGELSVPINKA